jgi:hypothetical protein
LFDHFAPVANALLAGISCAHNLHDVIALAFAFAVLVIPIAFVSFAY